jgi:hypothetical protein
MVMGRPVEYGERVAMKIRLPVEVYDRLAATARERGVPMNQLVSAAVDYWLGRLLPVEEVLRTVDDPPPPEASTRGLAKRHHP